MRVAVFGGGITGLTASYFLGKKGHQITLFEKEKVLGGLAAGFKQPNWDWYLEYTYHHLFANDNDILDFAREIGFNKIFFKAPETASIFEISNPNLKSKNFLIHPLDNPIDLLRFPFLSLTDKLRAGIILAFLKLSPFFPFYEKQTAEEFLKKTMGEKVWSELWQELFRKKFGDYAEIVLASFIWARIKKRTKNLGYVEGGFQTLINYIVDELRSLRVNVLTNYEIREIKKREGKYEIIGHFERSEKSSDRRERNASLDFSPRRNVGTRNDYDIVISTLPTPAMTKLTNNIFPKKYLDKFSKIKYLHALTLILETKEPLLEKTYWLNVSTPKIPIMGIVQHTNFMNKKNYGGNHIAYLGWYLKKEDKLMQMKDEELLDYVMPYLNKITNNQIPRNKQVSNHQLPIINSYIFRAPFAQPIFDKEFLKNKPDFKTPLKNFYIANLDMTYPYDRGINYAIKLGKQVAGMPAFND